MHLVMNQNKEHFLEESDDLISELKQYVGTKVSFNFDRNQNQIHFVDISAIYELYAKIRENVASMGNPCTKKQL